MNKVIVLIVFVALLTLPVMAADKPKAEVFGGYQYTRLGGDFGGINANGWNAAVNGNVNKWFGVTGDFSGTYKDGVHVYTYMFGPTISMRGNRFTPFVHALFGGFRATGAGSTNGLAVAVGGGADAKIVPHVAIRLGQFDWVMLHDNGITEKSNVRLSSGVVFRF